MDKAVTPIDVQLAISLPRDLADEKFLACALTGHADFLITGDKDFEGAQKLIQTKIVSVSMFKKLVCDAKTDWIDE